MPDLGPTQTLVLRALEVKDDEEADDVPPWHPYDGCYGCRRGDALAGRP
jgi:hypothetical protein